MPDNIYHLPKKSQLPEPLSPRIMLPSELAALPPEDHDDIVENLILKRMVNLLAGRAGTGKTYVAQMLQTATAAHKPWLGEAARHCRSFGIYSEDPKDKLKPRQEKICNYYDIGVDELDEWASFMPNDDGRFALYSHFKSIQGTVRTLWLQIEERCKDDGIELLILDNAQNIFEGDPNNPFQVNSFIRWLNGRARELNCAIVLLANPPKDRSSYFSGNQKWEDSCRHTLSLNPGEEDGSVILKVEKPNYVPYNHPFRRIGLELKWDDNILVRCASGEPIALGQIGRAMLDSRLVNAVTHCVNVLGETFITNPSSRRGYIPNRLTELPEWRKSISFRDIINSYERLLATGQLIKVEIKGKWYVRSAEAKPYLGETA